MDENFQEVKTGGRRVIRVSKRWIKIPLIIIGLIVIIVGVLFLFGVMRGASLNIYPHKAYDYEGVADLNSMPSPPGNIYNELSQVVYDKGGNIDQYFGRNPSQPTIKDTREFLKTSYNSKIKTRKVEEITKTVRNIIKGVNGRVDQYNTSNKLGYISFVVPASKFDEFKDEVSVLVNKKLYFETVNSQNLLGQKQNIELNRENILDTLANFKRQKEDLDREHTSKVNSIDKELSRIKSELSIIRTNISKNTDEDVLKNLKDQETLLISQENTQKQKLNSENNTYNTQSTSINRSIEDYNNILSGVNKQDDQFTDEIETVNGYVYIEWINIWQLAKIFSPIHPTIIIIILLIIAWIYSKRKGYVPRVEFQ